MKHPCDELIEQISWNLITPRAKQTVVFTETLPNAEYNLGEVISKLDAHLVKAEPLTDTYVRFININDELIEDVNLDYLGRLRFYHLNQDDPYVREIKSKSLMGVTVSYDENCSRIITFKIDSSITRNEFCSMFQDYTSCSK